jgi:hypothetical protein
MPGAGFQFGFVDHRRLLRLVSALRRLLADHRLSTALERTREEQKEAARTARAAS